MQKINNHHKPPRPPPLSVSLPSPTRPELPQTVSSHFTDDSDDQPVSKNDIALVPLDKYYSPLTSPLPATPENVHDPPPPLPPPHQIIQFSRREEVPPESGVVHGGVGVGEGEGGERKVRGREDVVRGSRKEEVVKKLGLGIRVLETGLCLISFSVMASDKTQGWSGDSFDRYKEYRFCLTVTIIGFVYSAFQAYDLGTHLVTGKHVITHRLRYHFDFLMDQIIAYLLISASSAAASRVDEWQANWGKDEFTEKASGSIGMAFLAFFCFAVSSLISGYNLCNLDLY